MSRTKPFSDAPLTVLLPAASERSPRVDVADALRSREFISRVLEECGHVPAPVDITPGMLRSPAAIMELARTAGAGCVFNIFEGFSHDSGAEHRFRTLLDHLSLPCTGNPPATLRACLSKDECCRRLRESGIPVPDGLSLFPGFDPSALSRLAPPLFIKPLAEDGSVGIDSSSLVLEPRLMLAAVSAKLSDFPEGVRVEEFIPGREYSVSCMGNDPYTTIGCSYIDFDREGGNYLDYDSKWTPGSPLYSVVPARAEGDEFTRAATLAEMAGRALGCRGCFRVDMRERCGELYVLDVNPNPDISPDGGFFRQCRESGMSDAQTVQALLGLAFEVQGGMCS